MKFNAVAVVVWLLLLGALGAWVYLDYRSVTPTIPTVTAPVTPPAVVPEKPAPVVKPTPRAAPPAKKVARRNPDPRCKDVPTEAYRHPVDVVIEAARRAGMYHPRSWTGSGGALIGRKLSFPSWKA